MSLNLIKYISPVIYWDNIPPSRIFLIKKILNKINAQKR